MKPDYKGALSCLGTILLVFLTVTLVSRSFGADNSMVWGASMYQDPKASRIGDLVTVMIMEDSEAEQASATARGKQGNLGFSASGKLSMLPAMSGTGETAYRGDLSTSRATSVTATVTAMVTGIYPNGNLYVEGTKNAMVNGERLEISVSGIIRPADIQSGNMVSSDYLANSNIVYKGVKEKGFWRTWKKILTAPFRLLEPLF